MTQNFEKQTKIPDSFEENTEKVKTPITTYLWVVLSVGLVCYPMISYVVLSMKNTSGFLEGFVLFFAPFILFPFFLFKTIRSFNPRTKLRFWIPIGAGIIFPVYIMFSHKFIIQKELKTNGLRTKGTLTINEEMIKSGFRPVSRKKDEKSSELESRRKAQREQEKLKSKPHNCVYTANGKIYNVVVYPAPIDVTKLTNTDTIEIIFSKTHPQIFLYGTDAENFKTEK